MNWILLHDGERVVNLEKFFQICVNNELWVSERIK